MSDQAKALRGLMERHQSSSDRWTKTPPVTARHATSIAMTSGKGGVGKSHLALNLAIQLAKTGSKVRLFDANFGHGSPELLCGLNAYWNLRHVLVGSRSLKEIMLDGPYGVQIAPGCGCLYEADEFPRAAFESLSSQLNYFEQSDDFWIFDMGSGLSRAVRRVASQMDMAFVVSTPEPTSLADAYATIKSLAAVENPPEIEVIVNQVESLSQADEISDRLQRTVRTFLQTKLNFAGSVPKDPEVVTATVDQEPFSLASPQSPAALAVGRISRRLRRLREDGRSRGRLSTFLKEHSEQTMLVPS
ncbi:P-loop NTPase [Thalassoroseus pseudoceratinae]|uniref:P-loop NTPase n=1 Tax=Thalassoroseus pseudoceratinae TaxID=2713176 RepID=UPI00142227E3|nr:P-loop NTPase [Thalassoroseus pseudoceratinae]